MSRFKPGQYVRVLRSGRIGNVSYVVQQSEIVGVQVPGLGITHYAVEELELWTIGARPDTVRGRVLNEAHQLITGDRNRSYGSPTENFRNTAAMWNTQFSHKLKDGAQFTASDVAAAMVHLKMARMIAGAKRDNWVDAVGYAACGAECDEEDRPNDD